MKSSDNDLDGNGCVIAEEGMCKLEYIERTVLMQKEKLKNAITMLTDPFVVSCNLV